MLLSTKLWSKLVWPGRLRVCEWSRSAGVTNSPNRLAVKIISALCLVTRTWTWDAAAICSAISALPTLHPGKLGTVHSGKVKVAHSCYNECRAEEAGWP